MAAVFGLLMLLLPLSHSVETGCDARQDEAQCYGALGGTLLLNLMDSASDMFKYQWLNKTSVILNGREKRIVHNLFKTRASFNPIYGTFRINNLKKADEGEYVLEIFDSHGYKKVHRTQQFTIQAPVSSVQMVSECLTQGEMRVSCLSEGGDSPQYSWTLDGKTLTDTQLLSGSNDNNNVTLKDDVSGRLVCSVSNHISRISVCGFKYINCTFPNGTFIPRWTINSSYDMCVEPTQPNRINTEGPSPSQCDLLAALLILLLIGIAVYFLCKRKKKIKTAEDFPGPVTINNQTPSVWVVEIISSELIQT